MGKNIRLKQLHGRLGDLVYQFTKVQFAQGAAPETWTPAVNAYRCQHGFAVCVDLAGVLPNQISLEVEPRRLRLHGKRETPEPHGQDKKTSQILAMEIDNGPFSREITFPSDVETDAARAECKNGYLWIYLPFKTQS